MTRPERILGLLLLLWTAASPRAAEAGAEEPAASAKPYALDDLVERTLKYHPLIRAAHEDIDVFEARLSQARYANVPRFSVDSFFTVQPSRVGDAANGDTVFDKWGPWSRTEVNMVVPIYTFGKFSALRRLARAGVDVARAKTDLARLEARRQVAEAYWGLVVAREILEVIADSKKQLDRAQARIDDMEEEDSDDYDPTDRLRLRIVQVDVDEKEIQARSGARILEDTLRQLADLSPDDPVRLEDERILSATAAAPPVLQLLDLARAHRPEMLALRGGLAASRAASALALARWLPDLALVGQFLFARSNVAEDQGSPFADDPFNTVGGGGGFLLRWDLDFVGHVAENREASAKVRRTRAQIHAAWLGIELQVRKARLDYEDGRERSRLAGRAYRAARGWLTAKADLFDGGFIDFEDLAFAVRAYYERKLKDLEARFRSIRARILLVQAVGLRSWDPVLMGARP